MIAKAMSEPCTWSATIHQWMLDVGVSPLKGDLATVTKAAARYRLRSHRLKEVEPAAQQWEARVWRSQAKQQEYWQRFDGGAWTLARLAECGETVKKHAGVGAA